jgi:hypothetical protein
MAASPYELALNRKQMLVHQRKNHTLIKEGMRCLAPGL